MKFNKYSLLFLAGLSLCACDDFDDITAQGDGLTKAQVSEAEFYSAARGEATFNGMFTLMGKRRSVFPSSSRADDFGFIAMAISQDAEGADFVYPNRGYNWFSVCGQLTSRTPSYANPFIRYSMPYQQIRVANVIIGKNVDNEAQLDDEGFVSTLKPVVINQIAQCLAIRAFDYMSLAPYFQFSYAAGAKEEPCVPLVTTSTKDFGNNPRVSVETIYNLVIKDLTWAINHLDETRKSKMYINKNVALGLRARAYLATEQWALAAADAKAAQEGFTPASIAEVSTPSFYNIADKNWIWGYDMTPEISDGQYNTWPSWLGSFSAKAYACGTQCYAQINKILYDKIDDTDVRKGWWVDANLHSPLLKTVTWAGVSGDDIATLKIDDVKEPYLPYTNVKFGAFTYPTTTNEEDYPFMRVEEMILIEVEGLAKSGKETEARTLLENFVKTYRNPSYVIPEASVRSFADEIWFQRRVELWGEGFAWSDIMRLNKPLVRFHKDAASNCPDAFKFNLPAKDPWMLMRFPQDETNYNLGVVNNTGGSAPTPEINPELKDGVTD